MKKLSFILSFFIAFQLSAQEGDNSYTMYHIITLKSLQGHGQDLRAGLKAHNSKYHQEGAQQVNVWSINSGPRTGTLSWVKGPLTWTDMDTQIAGDDHMDDWRKNVGAHSEMGEMEYWRLQDDLSYMPEGMQPKLFQVRYFDIKQDKNNNARHIIGTLTKAYKDTNSDMGFQVYTNQVNDESGRDWAILWFHDSFASMDRNRGFVAKYEKIFGDGSWDEFFEGWFDAADISSMELHVLQEDLSVSPQE